MYINKYNLIQSFEERSGLSFDDVKVHYNSDKPAQLQALAYTQGNQVYVGPGQEKHLGHELGHVVQQKQGRVRATTNVNGVAVNDDEGLEHEATKIAKSMPSSNHKFSTYQLKSMPYIQSSHIYQFTMDAFRADQYNNFNNAVGNHANEGARGEYAGNDEALDHLEQLNLDEDMEEYKEHMEQLPFLEGVNPLAGNHLFNTLGNSLNNFYNDLFDNIQNDNLYLNWLADDTINVNIQEVRYDQFEVVCEAHDQLRDVDLLRFYGPLASNNHITYSLYITKYLYDCFEYVNNATLGNMQGNLPQFDINQAIDQPALDAQEAAVQGGANEAAFYEHLHDFEQARHNLIETFEEAIIALANYLDNIAKQWFH